MRTIFMAVVLGILTQVASAGLAAQEKDRVKVDVGGYAQFQFNTTSVEDSDLGPDGRIAFSTFETRRLRPTFTAIVDDWIYGVLQVDVALGRLRVTDAFMEFAFDERARLRVGQFKKPFSLIELTSASKIVPIERAVRIRGLEDDFRRELAPFPEEIIPDLDGDAVLAEEQAILDALGYLGRDLGLSLHGELGRLAYHAGIFNGAGADERDDNDAKSFAGRLVFTPVDGIPLRLGGAASYREVAVIGDDGGADVEGGTLEGTAFELDLEWGDFRRPGLHFLLEGAAGDNMALLDDTFRGAQAWLAWFLPREGRVEGVQPLFRASFGDPGSDREDDEGWLLTPGVNLYFHSRNRVMLNWDLFLPASDRLESHNALRAQAQLYF